MVGGQGPMWVSKANPASLSEFARISPPRVLFNAHKMGCTDALPIHHGVCDFDSRISLTFWKGKFLVYARANLDYGIRWVQVTESTDMNTWSKFKLLKMSVFRVSKTSFSDNFPPEVCHGHRRFREQCNDRPGSQQLDSNIFDCDCPNCRSLYHSECT